MDPLHAPGKGLINKIEHGITISRSGIIIRGSKTDNDRQAILITLINTFMPCQYIQIIAIRVIN